MKWINLKTQSDKVPDKILTASGWVSNPASNEKALIEVGYRQWDEVEPVLAEGGKRIVQSWIQDPHDSAKCILSVVDKSAAEVAVDKAAEADAKAAIDAANAAIAKALSDIARVDPAVFKDVDQGNAIAALLAGVKLALGLKL